MAHAVVIVLGDLGRSPRMQYHAKSLAQLSPFGLITQIGYVGEEVMIRPNPTQHKAAVMVEKRIAPWEAPFLRRIALLHACTYSPHHTFLPFPAFPLLSTVS